MTTTSKPWLTYQRVSTDDQAREGVSLDAQRQACRHLAAAGGHTIAEDLIDPGFSAKNLKRPAIQRLLELVRGQQIGGVVVYKLDRLTRSMRDLLDLLALFEQHGVALISVSERLDTSSPMGRFVIGLIGLVAEWERETIAERVTVGMRHRMAQGGYVGGRVPAGLRVVGEPGKRALEVDPVQGPIVARLWPMIAQGGFLRQCGDYLQRSHVPCQGRDGWTINAVHKILRNERYVGLLVSAEDRDRALAVLASRTCPGRRAAPGGARGRSAKASRAWMLSGIATCGICGRALMGVSAHGSSGGMYHYYRCSGRNRRGTSYCRAKDLSADRWEPAVVEALVRLVGPDDLLLTRWLEIQRHSRAQTGDLAKQRTEIQMRRDRVGAEISRLVALAAAGKLVAEAVADGLAERQAEAHGLDVQLAALDGQAAMAEISDATAAAVIEHLRDGLLALPGRPHSEQVEAVKVLVKSATLRPDPSDPDKGAIDLVINMPMQTNGDREFVSRSPMVDRRGWETNGLRFSFQVCIERRVRSVV